MLNDFYCMKPSFFSKRAARREGVEKDASKMSNVLREKADDLEAQYPRVFKVNGREAVINISGPLSPDGPDWIDVYLGYGGTAYKNIMRAAEEALSLNESGVIDNVIVKINSPGGTVDGVDAAYQALQKINSIGIVRNEGIVASAAVWLASAFDTIIPGTDSAQIGSIGVVVDYYDFDGYYTNFGIEHISITNTESPNKRPDYKTEDGAEVLRRELDDLYNVFVSKVTAARPITKAQIDALRGEMLIASRAVELGLMDAAPTPDTGNGDAKKEKEGGQEMSTENMEKEIAIDAPSVDVSAEERKRVFGLLTVAGVTVSDSLKIAIETGVAVGDFAVMQAQAKQMETSAEIEAARKIRETHKDEEINISAEQNMESTEQPGLSKVDALLDARYKKEDK